MPKIQIDIFNGCNLRCPLCETGALKHPRGVTKIGADDYREILDSLSGFDEIHLFNKGESTLHPEICDFISMGKDRGFTMGLHSNLCIPQERLDKIISSGLDRLTASVDGTSQSRYGAYRKSGNFDQAFANLTFAAEKYHSGALSFLEWQFIVNRFNEEEVEGFIVIAAQMGINFRLEPIGIGQDVPDHFEVFDAYEYDWLPKDSRFQSSLFGGTVDEFGGQPVGEICPF